MLFPFELYSVDSCMKYQGPVSYMDCSNQASFSPGVSSAESAWWLRLTSDYF